MTLEPAWKAEMHRQILEHYRQIGMGGPVPGKEVKHASFQAALDAALAQARLGQPTWIKLTNCTESALVPAWGEEKTLVPHGDRKELPSGVHLLPAGSKRVGDALRDRYLEHLRELYSQGYLDTAEHDARMDAAMAAGTKDELELLVRDLPELPREEEKAKTSPPPLPVPRAAFIPALGLSAAVITGCLSQALHASLSTSHGQAVFSVSVLVMVINFVFMGVLLGMKKTRKRKDGT